MDKYELLHEYVANNEKNICEITAIKNGEIVFEDYWNGYKPGDTLHVMSVTKSVVGLLVGIAIDQGLIESVDQKVLDFFPNYVTKRGEKTIYDVTIRHLITMTAPYKYKSEPWTKVCTSPDWTIAALDLLGGKRGITGEFKYSTLGIQIANGIIASASGMKTIEYANKYLFEPLGIPKHRNKEDGSKEDQYNFLMSKLPKGDVWYSDPQGANTAGWGLALSATDMAKIGLLCLDRGEFQGKRIVSGKWIDAMLKPYQKLGDRFGNMSYGFLWWIIDEKEGVYAAIGDGGNVIYINRKTNVAVGVAGTFKPRIFDRVQFIQEYVEPIL